jgi:hypothetical protein
MLHISLASLKHHISVQRNNQLLYTSSESLKPEYQDNLEDILKSKTGFERFLAIDELMMRDSQFRTIRSEHEHWIKYGPSERKPGE